MKKILLAVVLLVACGASGPAGGPVSGAQDAHCSGDAGTIVTPDPNACHAAATGDAADYGAPLYNSEGDDDDCKYHVTFTTTPVRQNQDVTFTVAVAKLADHTAATGADVVPELFLSDTHPAPNSGTRTIEKANGTYEVGPIRFDAPGRWTLRFHLYEACSDAAASPHGHVAFFIDVP